MYTSSSTTTALIILALDAGCIAGVAVAMIHLWLHHPRQDSRTGRHRQGRTRPPLARTAALKTARDAAFGALDPDLTPRASDPLRGPTFPLVIPCDPWADTQDADSILAAIG